MSTVGAIRALLALSSGASQRSCDTVRVYLQQDSNPARAAALARRLMRDALGAAKL